MNWVSILAVHLQSFKSWRHESFYGKKKKRFNNTIITLNKSTSKLILNFESLNLFIFRRWYRALNLKSTEWQKMRMLTHNIMSLSNQLILILFSKQNKVRLGNGREGGFPKWLVIEGDPQNDLLEKKDTL